MFEAVNAAKSATRLEKDGSIYVWRNSRPDSDSREAHGADRSRSPWYGWQTPRTFSPKCRAPRLLQRPQLQRPQLQRLRLQRLRLQRLRLRP